MTKMSIDDLYQSLNSAGSLAVEQGVGGIVHSIQGLKPAEQLMAVGMVFLAMSDRIDFAPTRVYEIVDNMRYSREVRPGFNAMWMFFQNEWGS